MAESVEHETRRLWWAIPAGTALLLITVVMLFGGQPDKVDYGTSYDASGRGFRAAYLVLEELGFSVTRSRRPVGQGVRWVLFPSKPPDTQGQLKRWLRDGGQLFLADSSADFARELGIDLRVQTDAPDDEEPVAGIYAGRVAAGSTFVEWRGQRGEVLATAGDRPLLTVHPVGSGSVWLLNRPELVANNLLMQADNAVVLCRVAEAMTADGDVIAFDEYCHGLRSRPGVVELLFTPPTVWITLQGLLVLGVLLWLAMPRFGVLRRLATPSRRSKAEFLDAMASLLERKGDYVSAYLTVRAGVIRDVERALGLPPGTPLANLVAEAVARRGSRADALRRVLGPGAIGFANANSFIVALNELESARREFHN